MGFNRRKMEDRRRQAAEKEAAAPASHRRSGARGRRTADRRMERASGQAYADDLLADDRRRDQGRLLVSVGALPCLPRHWRRRSAQARSPSRRGRHKPDPVTVVPFVPAARTVRRACAPVPDQHCRRTARGTHAPCSRRVTTVAGSGDRGAKQTCGIGLMRTSQGIALLPAGVWLPSRVCGPVGHVTAIEAKTNQRRSQHLGEASRSSNSSAWFTRTTGKRNIRLHLALRRKRESNISSVHTGGTISPLSAVTKTARIIGSYCHRWASNHNRAVFNAGARGIGFENGCACVWSLLLSNGHGHF